MKVSKTSGKKHKGLGLGSGFFFLEPKMTSNSKQKKPKSQKDEQLVFQNSR